MNRKRLVSSRAMHRTLPTLLLAALPLACGEAPPPPKAPDALERFTLAADPGSSLSVNEAKEKGPGEEVVVVGRLNKVVRGFAAFNLVDASLDYCGQKEGKKCCDTPWDY
jgi:hypothetical protein